MTPRTVSRRSTAANRVTLRRPVSLIETWRTLVKDLFDPYRPELHYMRGPGPKWREKHQPALVHVPARAEPSLVRVRA
jgi:hypothetical protein